MIRFLLLSFFSFALAGCVANGSDSVTSAAHPANPDAAEAQIAHSPQTLAAFATSELPAHSSIQANPHAGHDMGAMQSGPNAAPATTQAASSYTCPMHPEVFSSTLGKCPKCGMNLVKKAAAPAAGGGHDGH